MTITAASDCMTALVSAVTAAKNEISDDDCAIINCKTLVTGNYSKTVKDIL